VREAVVVGVPDDRVGEEVVAVVVPTGPACDPAAVQAFVRERVAAYKYPRRVILVADLPRSPNGKILRREIDVEALQR
jgi:long-chain acyl-CoA synthetase